MFLKSKMRELNARKMVLVDEIDVQRNALRLQTNRLLESNVLVTQVLGIAGTVIPLAKALFRK